MNTQEIATKLQEMAAQILTPSSKGKHFFNEASTHLLALEKENAELRRVTEPIRVILRQAATNIEEVNRYHVLREARGSPPNSLVATPYCGGYNLSMSEHDLGRLWEEIHRLKNKLHEIREKQRKIMSQITEFTTSVQSNLDQISTDLENIARQIASGGGTLSAADVLALATFKTNIAAVQAKADQMVVQSGKVPTITTQPQSQTVAAGQPAAFGVVAADDVPLTYQWLKDGAPVGNNSPTLNILSVTPADAGLYVVVCANPVGSAVSNVAQLTVA